MEYATLQNGLKMPMLGYGTIGQAGEQIADNVAFALRHGYELIDTANRYGNEVEVGRGLKKSGLKREDYFLETKLGPTLYENEAAIDGTLKRLGVDTIDLMILHHPVNNYLYAYGMLERAYKAGKLRAIGVSNFYPDRLIDLCQFVEVTPAVNQVETHVFQQQKAAHEYMEKYHVQHESWGPFAEGRKDFFTNPTLVEIGQKYAKSSAQVALRFLLQSDVVVIPKSTHKERMEQNINVFDFTLSGEDMAAIRKLGEGESLFFSHYDPATVEMLTNMGKTRIV